MLKLVNFILFVFYHSFSKGRGGKKRQKRAGLKARETEDPSVSNLLQTFQIQTLPLLKTDIVSFLLSLSCQVTAKNAGIFMANAVTDVSKRKRSMFYAQIISYAV